MRKPERIPSGYKRCCRCKRILPVTEFQKNRARWDGLGESCKDCRIEIRRAHYDTHRAAECQSNAAWRANNSEWRKFAVRARNRVAYDRKTGKHKVPATCAICDKPGMRLAAHHPDYAAPSKITYLCPRCHRAADMGKVAVKVVMDSGTGEVEVWTGKGSTVTQQGESYGLARAV